MRKIWAIVSKELYITFSNRNLLLIMIVTPLVLSTIIGLAFGGLGGDDSQGLSLSDIPIVIVNLDEGAALGNGIGGGLGANNQGGNGQSFNGGDQIVAILAPELAQGQNAFGAGGDQPVCSLIPEAGAESGSRYSGTLEELFASALMDDPDAARAAVEQGDYAAAIIIPPAFSQAVTPRIQFGPVADQPAAETTGADAAVEVYANAGQPIEAGVTRSVVEAIVGQLIRFNVAITAMGQAIGQQIAASPIDLGDVDPASVPAQDASLEDWRAFLAANADRSPWFAGLAASLTRFEAAAGGTANADLGAVVACLFDPNFDPIQVKQQPLNPVQAQSIFQQIMVQIGAAQAVFFALFTGIFGVLSIYEERKNWTLQRMLASPTSRSSILAGKLGGNVAVVWAQLALLMLFLTLVTSAILRSSVNIWGDQWGLLLLTTVALSLAVSGLGVLVVGLARTPEQVQALGPVIAIFLGALGGAFGFALPDVLANLSLITWGVDAFKSLAAGQGDIWLNLAVLFGQGALFFVIGVWLFRRRVEI